VRVIKLLIKLVLIPVSTILELAVLLWIGLYLYANLSIPQGVAVEYVKGVWEPMAPFMFILDADRVKGDGINTISIGPYAFNPVTSFLSKPIIGATIKRAHQKGLAVHLAPVSWGPGFSADDPRPEMESLLTEMAVDWAKFAERYRVEFYSPQNEPDVVLGAEGAEKWAKEILPEVKEHYSGTTVLKLGMIMVEEDVELEGKYLLKFATWGEYDQERVVWVAFPKSSGWDYLMVDIFPPDETDRLEEFPKDLARYLEAANDWAEIQGNRGVMIGEFAYPRDKTTLFGIDDIMPGMVVTPEEQAQRTGEYLETAIPNTEGVIYCGWVLPGYSLKGYPVEKVVKDKFLE
jgi:hypothetical protein